MTTAHQLQSLQSQINPHFLLNSLQTIYALSLEKSERSPEVILQLAEILKYTLYETGHPNVALEKEIAMIRDYVDMYRHRVDADRTDIRMEENGDPERFLIAPMLLIPFIENSFKHGLLSGREKSFIDIQIDILEDKLLFKICNSCGKSELDEVQHQKGIGIENVKSRLSLIYPEKHYISIVKEESSFKVKLEIHDNSNSN